MAKGDYSKNSWMYRDDLNKLSLSQLAIEADKAARFTRVTTKNLLRDVGETYSIRELLTSKFFNKTIGKNGNEIISITISDKTKSELVQMVKSMQTFALGKTKTKTGLKQWADKQRESLKRSGYVFQDNATDSELDWIYSMIRDVINAFGDTKSPPNIVEAIWELIMDNQDMTYEEIKEEAIRKIQEGEYHVDLNNDVIWE